ncbi:uncharacterized protein [Halyomorpha halys]|uniref:uncharacterized protein n=1 Tax=Halyomorpha halys TaxID=286706 RepID=UPI0034D2CEF8
MICRLANTVKRPGNFKYLESVITYDSRMKEEVIARLSRGNNKLSSLRLSKKAKLMIHETNLRPTVTYGSEFWVLTNKSRRKLNVLERKILRKIFGPIRDNELRKFQSSVYWKPDLVSFVSKIRLRWLGHVERMSEKKMPRHMLYGKNREN